MLRIKFQLGLPHLQMSRKTEMQTCFCPLTPNTLMAKPFSPGDTTILCLSHQHAMPRASSCHLLGQPQAFVPLFCSHSLFPTFSFCLTVTSSAVCPHNVRPVSSQKNFHLGIMSSTPQLLPPVPEVARRP